jgi:hypothetical protein
VDAAPVVKGRIERQGVTMAGQLLEKAFDRCVKRFMFMRIVRF